MASPSYGGVVKSWNGMKGFGFITSDGFGGDVMFSKKDLAEDLREVQGKFLQGKAVAFDAAEGVDGRMKATAVQLVMVEGQAVAGMIKSYSEKNGYGFINSTAMGGEDLRFQNRDIPQAAMGANIIGQLVTFQVKTRPDGKMMACQLQFQSGQTAQRFSQLGFPDGMAHNPSPKGFGKGGMMQGGCGGGDGGMKTGMVKTFSEKNGYGFITSPGQPSDIKFGQADLAGGTVTSGTQVSFSVAYLPDGRIQAKNVQVGGGGGGGCGGKGGYGMKRPGEGPQNYDGGPIEPTGPAKRPRAGGGDGGIGAGEGEWVSGTVKSFNSAKGFGFISSPETSSDIYFNANTLGPEAQAAITSLVGSSVSCQLASVPDGKIRASSVTLL